MDSGSSKTITAHENFIYEAPTKNVATEAMGLHHSGSLVKRISEGASPFAAVRELTENAIQAGATRIDIGPDWVGVKTAMDMKRPAAYKLMFSDNGEGIARGKMKLLLNNLAATTRSLGSDGNFGIGAKVSALPWNPYGMIFQSWTKDGNEGMVRLFKRSDADYALFRWNESDDDGEKFVDLTSPPSAYRKQWQKTSGTNVILCGRSDDDDTVLGPEEHNAGNYVLLHILNDRYYQFPDNVKVNVFVPPTSNKAKWPKTEQDARANSCYRQVKGAKHFLDQYAAASGTIKANGAKLHWWWHPDVKSSSFNAYASVLGYVGVLYNNELYNVSRPIKGQHLQLISLFAKFGMFFDEVYKNVTILVEPNKATEANPGVAPDLSRGQLRMVNGNQLPWDDWGKSFCDNMPQVLQDAIDKAGDGTESTFDHSAKLKEFFDRMDIYGSSSSGSSNSVDSSSIPRRRPSRSTPANASDNNSGNRPTKYNVPAINWVRPSDLSDDVDLFQGKAVHYQESANTILFNADFPLWNQVIDHWTSKYPAGGSGASLRKKVQATVRQVYEATVIVRIVHVRRFRGRPDWSTAAIDRALSNEALTVAVLGLQDADTHISGSLKGAIKMRRNDNKTHGHGQADNDEPKANWPGMTVSF